MSAADGHVLHVEDLGDVVRMDAVEVERDDSRPPVCRRSVRHQAGDLRQPLERVGGELVLVLLDRVEPDLGDVVQRRGEADSLGDRLRSGLELVRQLPPGRLLDLDLADHVAAGVEGGHLLEQLRPPPQRADTTWAA